MPVKYAQYTYWSLSESTRHNSAFHSYADVLDFPDMSVSAWPEKRIALERPRLLVSRISVRELLLVALPSARPEELFPALTAESERDNQVSVSFRDTMENAVVVSKKIQGRSGAHRHTAFFRIRLLTGPGAGRVIDKFIPLPN